MGLDSSGEAPISGMIRESAQITAIKAAEKLVTNEQASLGDVGDYLKNVAQLWGEVAQSRLAVPKITGSWRDAPRNTSFPEKDNNLSNQEVMVLESRAIGLMERTTIMSKPVEEMSREEAVSAIRGLVLANGRGALHPKAMDSLAGSLEQRVMALQNASKGKVPA